MLSQVRERKNQMHIISISHAVIQDFRMIVDSVQTLEKGTTAVTGIRIETAKIHTEIIVPTGIEVIVDLETKPGREMTIDIDQEIALGKEVDLEKDEVVSEITDNQVGHQVGDVHSDPIVGVGKIVEKERGQKVPIPLDQNIRVLEKEIRLQALMQRDCVMVAKAAHTKCGSVLHCSRI